MLYETEPTDKTDKTEKPRTKARVRFIQGCTALSILTVLNKYGSVQELRSSLIFLLF